MDRHVSKRFGSAGPPPSGPHIRGFHAAERPEAVRWDLHRSPVFRKRPIRGADGFLLRLAAKACRCGTRPPQCATSRRSRTTDSLKSSDAPNGSQKSVARWSPSPPSKNSPPRPDRNPPPPPSASPTPSGAKKSSSSQKNQPPRAKTSSKKPGPTESPELCVPKSRVETKIPTLGTGKSDYLTLASRHAATLQSESAEE